MTSRGFRGTTAKGSRDGLSSNSYSDFAGLANGCYSKEGFTPAKKNIFSSCSFQGEEGLNQRDEQRQSNGMFGIP